MKTASRIVAGVAALVLMLAFLLPLWTIKLEAPQYPEGLGMNIRVNTIEGVKPHDLQNINGLNHYIGMARIEPESIPELRYMPWILGGLVLLGLATAITGKRKVLVTWTGVFLVTAVVGVADFYRWEYNYGHNLNPEAAIKVPGMDYQPPLIGTAKLLNFKAHSWPGSGGWIAIAVFLTAFGLTTLELRAGKRERKIVPIEPALGKMYRNVPVG